MSVVWMFGGGHLYALPPNLLRWVVFLLIPMLIIATNTRTPFFTSTSCAQALVIFHNFGSLISDDDLQP